ncbi:hypothetical protein B5X24_HaOG216542 [Helicoverpa armigera]|nr:hypothetical protein B5X24_HaOG216542 [Helicoverpa armigera]
MQLPFSFGKTRYAQLAAGIKKNISKLVKHKAGNKTIENSQNMRYVDHNNNQVTVKAVDKATTELRRDIRMSSDYSYIENVKESYRPRSVENYNSLLETTLEDQVDDSNYIDDPKDRSELKLFKDFFS